MTWLPLADRNPVPGDACDVEELAASFTDRAARLRTIASELKRLDTGGFWEGDAAEAFAERRGRFLPHIEAVATRWEAGGRALAAWADAMRESQTQARRALEKARTADELRAEAQRRLDTAREEFGAHLPEAMISPATVSPRFDFEAVRFWERQVADRDSELSCARTLLEQAEELYDQGARRCEAALDNAADDAIEDDHSLLARARRTTHGVVRRFPQIKTIAKYVGLAAGTLAIAASMFTGVGALATLAFIAGGGATLLDTALLVSGDGKWTTVAWDAFGLLTFGLGRAYASAARGTAAFAVVEDARTLRNAPTLKGIVAEGIRSTRPLVGAAERSRRLALYQEWRTFASEASQGAWPNARNWWRAMTFWKEIRIPPPDVLNLSARAARYAGISQILQGVGTANDIRGVVAGELEVLEGHDGSH